MSRFESLPGDEKAILAGLLKALKPFHDLNSTMPLQYVTAFLSVARNEGLNVTEYAKSVIRRIMGCYFSRATGWAFSVFCKGAVTANKWRGVSAEGRSLSRRRSFQPALARPFSFSRQPSMAVAPGLKGSFGFCLQPDLD
jgi:hypothetical protein